MFKRVLVVLVIGPLFSAGASASCICRCINGEMQPICSSSIEVPPICPPTVCQVVPPSVAPIQSPMVPPVGASSCAPEQVLNPNTLQYEWHTICR
jgi:hypothetical protein